MKGTPTGCPAFSSPDRAEPTPRQNTYAAVAGSIAGFVLCLTQTGCTPSSTNADDSIGGEWIADREQFADTTIVRTIGGSVWRDSTSLVPEVVIGELDGPPPVVFGFIAGIDVDAAGQIFVVDRQASEIRVFSPDGEHLDTFGSPGRAPGELVGPDHIRVTTDGRIIVRDQSGADFSVFSDDGDYLAGWPRGSGYGTTAPFYLTESERVVNPSLPGQLVSYDLTGAALDTLPVPTLGFEPPTLTVAFEGGSSSWSIPFARSEDWTMTRDGSIIIGSSDSYSFDRRNANGGVLRIERSTDPVEVPTAEAAQARERLTRTIRRSGNPQWNWTGPAVPATKPAFLRLVSGVDGTTWVFREGPSIEKPNPDFDAGEPDAGFPTTWHRPFVADVFDSDGRYLGPVRLPPSLNWSYPRPVLSSDWVVGVVTHPDGFPQVVRFRLVR